MVSPWMDGSQGTYAPPAPGLAQLLEAGAQRRQQAWANLGTTLGQFGAGVAGAVQGAQDPGTFGPDTSTAGGAFRGFVQNLAAAQPGNGGSTGGAMSGFADLVNGGGGRGGGGTPNFKQLQAMGKTADAFRDQLKSAQPQVDGQAEQPVLGASDDEWDTLGAMQKYAKVQGYMQGQTQQLVTSKLQDFAAQAQERQAQAVAAADTGTFLKAYGASNGSPQDKLNAGLGALRPGADVTRVLPQAIGALSKFAAMSPTAPQATFVTDPKTGARFLQAGKDVLPSGTDTTVQPPQVLDATDDEGNPTGYKVVLPPGGKGPPKVIVPKQAAPLSARSEEIVNPLDNTPTGQFKTIITGDPDAVMAWHKKNGTAAAVAAPGATDNGAATPALPTDKKQWKTGQRYLTNKGELTWDGSKFVK